MSYILCIETSTQVCSVAISQNGECIHVDQLELGNKHSAGLTTLIKRVLAIANMQMSDISAIAISDGPGSYTGLRVGASTAKGMCYALSIPLIAIPTLAAISDHAISSLDIDADIYIPTIDARRMEVYAAQYISDACLLSTHSLIYTDDSLAKIVAQHPDRSIAIIGDGAQKLQEQDEITIPPSISIHPYGCSATHMCRLASIYHDARQHVDVAYHAPHYYKSPKITKPKARI